VPGLSVQSSGPGAQRLSLRGVNSAGEATVGLYFDETPISGSVGTTSDAGSRNADIDLFDVDRIEVLRGPQGTLYGASSMGGAIRIIYQKPQHEYAGAVRLGVSTTDGGALSHSAEGMVNLPLREGTLAARVTGYKRDTGGYVDNTFLGINNVNSLRAEGAKFQLRYTPLDTLTIDLGHTLGTTRAFSSAWVPTFGQYIQRSQVKLPYYDDNTVSSFTVNWDMQWADLTFNSSYQDRASTYISDDSYFIGTFRNESRCQERFNSGIACSTGRLVEFYDYLDSIIPAALIHDGLTTDWTNELRLTSHDSEVLDWSVGIFSQRRKNRVQSTTAHADAASGILITPWDMIYSRWIWDALEQKALFGEVTWHMTPRLNLTAGLRYYDYDKVVSGLTDIGWPLIAARERPLSSADASEDGLLKKLTLDFNMHENLMFYATIADGFRPGGANQVIGLSDMLVAYHADTLWNYEIGMKSSWRERSLLLNAAIYRIDWDDMQVLGRTLDNAFSFLSNAGAAKMEGIEVEAVWRPVAGLDLAANFNYVDARLTEDQISSVISGPGRKGDRIPSIPQFSGMFSATLRHPVGDALDWMGRFDLSHVGKHYSSFRPNDPFRHEREAGTTLNLRTGLEHFEAGFSVHLYVRNLTNKVLMTQSSMSSTPPGISVNSIAPRTIGLQISKEF